MALGLTYDPQYPEAGDEVALTLTGGTGDPAYARWDLIAVPDQSELELGMLVDGTGAFIQTFTPDVPGAYEFTGYDVRAYVGFGQFATDANGGVRQVIVGVTASRTFVYVVSPTDLRIGTIPGHDATLRLGVADLRIRTAEIVDPATDLARRASIDPSVTGPVDALVDQLVSDVCPTLTARVIALTSKYSAHRATGSTVHLAADAVNVVRVDPVNSDETALAALGELYDIMLAHTTAGSVLGTWHTDGDTKNSPITPKPSTKAQAHVTASDLEERVYEKHRIQTLSPASHGSSDTTNALADPKLLTSAVVAYLDYIAANTTDAIDGENEGATLAERLIGMTPPP